MTMMRSNIILLRKVGLTGDIPSHPQYLGGAEGQEPIHIKILDSRRSGTYLT